MPNSNINQTQEIISNVINNIAPIMLSGALAYYGFNTSNTLTATAGTGVASCLLWKYSTGTSLAETTETIGAVVSTARLMYDLKYSHPLKHGNGPGAIRFRI